MSREIIKSISITKDKVFITSHSSNVYPKIPHKWEAKGLTDMLNSVGREAVEKEILEQFCNGNFEGVSTTYGKLAHMFSIDRAYELLQEAKSDKNKYHIISPNGGYIMSVGKTEYKLIDALYLAHKFKCVMKPVSIGE